MLNVNMSLVVLLSELEVFEMVNVDVEEYVVIDDFELDFDEEGEWI